MGIIISKIFMKRSESHDDFCSSLKDVFIEPEQKQKHYQPPSSFPIQIPKRKCNL